MGRPREHGPETEQRLLRAAGHLLATEGTGAVTVRRVANHAGVSSRAVYSLFGSMEGLLTEFCRRGSTALVRRHEQVPRKRDAAQEILPLALAYRRAALDSPDFYRLLYERGMLTFDADESETEAASRSFARVHDAVERALSQRGLDRDPARVTRQLWAVVHGLASLELRCLLGPPEEADAAWSDTMGVLVAGLFPGAPASRTRRPAASQS